MLVEFQGPGDCCSRCCMTLALLLVDAVVARAVVALVLAVSVELGATKATAMVHAVFVAPQDAFSLTHQKLGSSDAQATALSSFVPPTADSSSAGWRWQ